MTTSSKYCVYCGLYLKGAQSDFYECNSCHAYACQACDTKTCPSCGGTIQKGS